MDLDNMKMIANPEIDPAVARLERLFEKRLNLRHGTFETRAARARRHLPRRLRRDLQTVLAARRVGGNPKLARLTDGRALSAACARIERYLSTVDLADRRKGRRLALLGVLIANVLVVFALAVGVLLWRGYL